MSDLPKKKMMDDLNQFINLVTTESLKIHNVASSVIPFNPEKWKEKLDQIRELSMAIGKTVHDAYVNLHYQNEIVPAIMKALKDSAYPYEVYMCPIYHTYGRYYDRGVLILVEHDEDNLPLERTVDKVLNGVLDHIHPLFFIDIPEPGNNYVKVNIIEYTEDDPFWHVYHPTKIEELREKVKTIMNDPSCAKEIIDAMKDAAEKAVDQDDQMRIAMSKMDWNKPVDI